MQDSHSISLRESWLHQSHKNYLTPYNVDTLVSCLHQIRDQQLSLYNPKQQRNCSYVDTYINATLTLSDRPTTVPHHKKERISHHHYWSKLEPLSKTHLHHTPTKIINKDLLSLAATPVTIQPIKKQSIPASSKLSDDQHSRYSSVV